MALGEKSSTAVAKLLRSAILSGELQPAATLGEVALGRELGVSRTPIREALLRLHAEGLIEMPPNRPARVRSFDAADLREMHSLRAVLEGHAAALAATQATASDLRALEASCERFARLAREDGDLLSLAEENLTFHGIISLAAGSGRLQAMIAQVSALPLIYRSYMSYSAENRRSACRQHRDILDALEGRDAEIAERAMKTHVQWALELALEHLPLRAQADVASP